MFISIIIPTCNRNDTLSKCLDKLTAQIQNTANYEIIVSDDSKNSEAKNLIEVNYSWVQWVKGKQKGPAANRNNGAQHAKGKWLIFLDDDVIPAKDLLNTYLDAITKNKNVFAFEGSIYPDNEKLLEKDMAECPVNTKGGLFWSANICINTDLFNALHGFNEMYILAAQEDQQMKIDIEKNGNKILFIKEAKVIHPVRFTSIKKQVQRIPLASKNFCLYASKNRKILGYTSLLKFSTSQYFFHIKTFIELFKKGRYKSSIVSLVYFVYGLPLNIINFYSFNRRYSNASEKF